MIRIGDFSKLSRISIRMLRHYNEIGLLIPECVDDFTGYRYYGEAQLPLAGRIGALKSMGFSLAVIAEILKEYGDPRALEKYLSLKYAEIKEQAENTNRQLLLLETTISRLRKDDNVMNYNVVLKEMPQKNVAALRKIIPSYEEEGKLWEQLWKEITPLNVKTASPADSTAVFFDEGYKEHDADVEVQISVEGAYQNTENVTFKTIAPVLAATVTFKGGYEQMPVVCEATANWVSDNGYDFNGAMFNIYHVSPAGGNNPEDWVTEVCFPVKKK